MKLKYMQQKLHATKKYTQLKNYAWLKWHATKKLRVTEMTRN